MLQLLVANPWFTGRTSTAALVRKIARDEPALLLDESDTAFKGEREYAEALRGVLNSGYRRGGAASVCLGKSNGTFEVADLATFCPKAIAGIGKLPDTVASRSISIRLKKRKRSEPVERFREKKVRDHAVGIAQTLAEELQRIELELAEAEPALPDQLSDRQQDVWEPLIAIADVARGKWPVRSRHAAVALAGSRPTEAQSYGVRLLEDSRRAFDEDGAERLKSKEFLLRLHSMEEAPWGEWFGKPLSANRLGALLGEYDIHPRSMRFDDGANRKGYQRSMFEDAWERHLPQERASETSQRHNGSSKPETPISEASHDPTCDGSENGQKPLQQANVTDVTVQDGGVGI
ncbi:MAG: DUF3631 domain-containing protein [Solirubrobacterales bacterium]